MRRLGSARDLLGRYQGRTGHAQREWLRKHEAGAIAFMRAYRNAMEWLYSDRTRDEAAGLLMAHDKSLTSVLAHRSLDVLLDEKDGFFRDLALDMRGIETCSPFVPATVHPHIPSTIP